MADLAYRVAGPSLDRRGTPWGAIWAGVFSFVAIWSVFGMLGAAIFSTAGNTAAPSSGISWGMGIWSIILTMIAMFIGGRVTARLAESTTRQDAILCGQTMFGLAVLSVLVIVELTGAASASLAAARAPFLLGVISSVGWFGWVALFLGWLCAMGGAAASQGAARQQSAAVHDIRSAA